uniref:Voltage-gated ion channel superfamily n=1 Tax=Tetraselmis sp. GSL018 TaxID=582737 RepID=A0A061R4I4_9CHLO
MATIEDACIMLFTCEYVAKLLTAPRVLEFIRGPLNLIDLVAIIPWYLQFATGRQGLAASVLRIIRLARILKLGGRWGKVQVVTRALLHSLDVLAVLLFLMLATVVIFSALIYYTEEGRAEEADVEGFGSIPESFWWTVVTINTVGYGDVVPITDWGKAVASLLMVVGLLVMALPVSVIGTNFTQEWMEYKDNLTPTRRPRRTSHQT